MSEPKRDDAGATAPPTSAEPTVQVGPPPVPGRAVRAQLAAGELATPPVREDEPTELDGPPPTGVTVGSRPRRRRRTWPWILAVVLALVVLGAVLLVMLGRGAIIDPDLFRFGGLPGTGDLVGWPGGTVPR